MIHSSISTGTHSALPFVLEPFNWGFMIQNCLVWWSEIARFMDQNSMLKFACFKTECYRPTILHCFMTQNYLALTAKIFLVDLVTDGWLAQIKTLVRNWLCLLLWWFRKPMDLLPEIDIGGGCGVVQSCFPETVGGGLGGVWTWFSALPVVLLVSCRGHVCFQNTWLCEIWVGYTKILDSKEDKYRALFRCAKMRYRPRKLNGLRRRRPIAEGPEIAGFSCFL